MSDVDVLIVGAGPTGTMLALELAIQNVSFRIIDKEPVRSDKSRALVIQPRSLELFSRHGIAHEIVALGTIGVGARIFVNKRLAAELVLDDLGLDDTAFTLPLWISQADTERFLDQALQRHGHTVERPFTAEKVEQDDTGVTVSLLNQHNGASERLRCKYVVGCDGAHSVVRHAANLSFDGAPYAQDFILADLRLDWPLYAEDPKLTFFLGQTMLVAFPLHDGLYRLIGSRPGGVAENGEPTLADFQRIFDAMTPGGVARLHDPVWITRFRLHHRGANAYRAGRLFVAGDAAHIHSPAGGQGMNTGLQDAVNLGWKLGVVLHGGAARGEALLDSYDIERRRVGEHLLRGTDQAFSYGTSQNAIFVFLRNFLVPWVMPWAFASRARRAKMFRFFSQLGIRYRHSPVVGTAKAYLGPLRGGDRTPDGKLQGRDGGATSLLAWCTGSGHHFIMFAGTGDAAVDDETILRLADGFLKISDGWAKTRKIFTQPSLAGLGGLDEEAKLHARYGFVAPGYVLVRPDGYVAHIGLLGAIDELLAWSKSYMTSSS